MIRRITAGELPRVLEIYAAARDFMERSGNPGQWGKHYPSRQTLLEDIALQRLYGVEEEGKLWGCFMLTGGPDPTYARIFDGQWGSDAPYGVLHRVAGDGSRKGLVALCTAFAFERFSYLRVDTHEKNLPMQHALARQGFVPRGMILAGDGTPRIAYDKQL